MAILPTRDGTARSWRLRAIAIGLLFVLAGGTVEAQDGDAPTRAFRPLPPVEQPPPIDPAKAARMEGTVVDRAGKPVSHAQVKLTEAESGATYLGVSDDAGRFSLDGIEADIDLYLTAVKAGYAEARYGTKSPTGLTPAFELKQAELVRGVVLTLTEQAVLTGRVVDTAGDPSPYTIVFALMRSWEGGVRHLERAAQTSTDDRGEFRLAGLAPNRYYLVAGSGVLDGNSVFTPSTYYPSAADADGAEPIDVKVGEEKHGLDIQLLPSEGYRVRGRLAGSSIADSGRGGYVMLTPEAAAEFPDNLLAHFSTDLQPGGSFVLEHVPPGRYLALSPVNRSVTTVTVTNADVDGVLLAPPPGVRVTGKVRFDGGTPREIISSPRAGDATAPGAPEEMSGFTLILHPADQQLVRNRADGAVKNNGTYVIENAPLGRYTLEQGDIPDVYIQSARQGDRDAIESGIDIETDTTLDVVYRGSAPDVTGIVKNARGEPQGGPVVVLFPEKPWLGFDSKGAWTAPTDRSGAFAMQSVRPGTYYAVALEETDFGTAMVRELLDQFAGVAKKIEVKEGEPLIVEPTLIPADKVREAREALDKLP